MDANRGRPLDRRRMLETTISGVALTSLAGCLASGSEGSAEPADFDGWFDNVSNYDGVVDRTGNDTVTVAVGASAGGGHHAFAPAAVRVSTGTTVVWKWTGDGGLHNVVASDGTFESELAEREGETFEYTFEQEGTWRYFCAPHRTSGMKGAIVTE